MISVCILTYNGAKYIHEQLVSILNQLESQDEIIISDDGSTDGTEEIINNFKDKRIKYYNHKKENIKFKGTMALCYIVGRNAENALRKAKGDYIFLADQDDVWLPGKIKVCKEGLKNYDLVITNHIPVKSNLENFTTSQKLAEIKTPSLWNTLIHTQFLGCCMAFRKELLNKILPFPKEPLMHDIWIGLMALKYGKIGIIQAPYLLYRRHGSNASVNIENKSKNSLGFKLMYRYYLIKAYFLR